MKLSKIWIVTSILISVLVLISSLSGILISSTYSQESKNWALQAVGQDIGNLLAVAFFLVATFLMTQNSYKALTIWIGSLLYFIYAYLIYAFFIHFNFLFLIYNAVLGLSVFTLIGGLLDFDLNQLSKTFFVSKTKEASGLLLIIGFLFALLWLKEIIPSLLTGQIPQSIKLANLWVNPVHVIDLALVLPGMILTGILLIRKNKIGYLFAAPWLCFSVLMGSGILANLILELKAGNNAAFEPFIFIGLIVVSSGIVLFRFLKQIKE